MRACSRTNRPAGFVSAVHDTSLSPMWTSRPASSTATFAPAGTVTAGPSSAPSSAERSRRVPSARDRLRTFAASAALPTSVPPRTSTTRLDAPPTPVSSSAPAPVFARPVADRAPIVSVPSATSSTRKFVSGAWSFRASPESGFGTAM